MIAEIVRATSLGELLLKAKNSKAQTVIPDEQSATLIRDNLSKDIHDNLNKLREQNERDAVNQSSMGTFLF